MNSDIGACVTDEGIWLSLVGASAAEPVPALFLDRDGVIIEDTGYVGSPEEVRLLPFAVEMVRRANRAGVPVVVVTNQSGIARGLFGWDEFAVVERRITELLKREGGRLDAVAACPFHGDFTPGYGDRHARWRKPGPRMLTTLAEDLNLAPGRSWLVGDKATDIQAARAAGLAGAVHVGNEAERTVALEEVGPEFSVLCAEDVNEVIALLNMRLEGYAGPEEN